MLDLSVVAVIIKGTMGKRLKKMQRTVAKALDKTADVIRNLGVEPTTTDTPSLLPLTPRYEKSDHEVYVEAIERALELDDEDAPVRNIALTGSYGVGKSSILAEVRRRHDKNAIAVSLSTLGFEGVNPSPNDVAGTKTNLIQKEIVKQLLYSQDPVKMPGSRYRRISRFRFWREFGLAALIAVPLAVACFLLGWTASLSAVVTVPEGWALAPNAVVYLMLTLLLLGLRFVSYNRIHISQLTAGEATIALSPQSATYFDEYLDEIVYFFEKVDCDVVIFEDIDRFDDAHIFETLRSLNSILNGARQLKGRQVRFIYAIKDSIFDQLGVRAAKEELDGEESTGDAKEAEAADAAEAEVARANRTKFFDLVIPVVPFITHRSARDLLITKMKDLEHEVSPRLIDLAARHIADMRLIKNVRNEFVIFKSQILDKGSLKLTQNGLFAMMLYKSTHLSDFELIKLGKSDLDSVYQAHRDLVNENRKSLSRNIAKDRRELRSLVSITDRGEAFAAALTSEVERTVRYIGGSRIQYEFQGASVDEATLETDEFWVGLADAQDGITVSYRGGPYGQGSYVVSHADLVEITGDSLATAAWREAERVRLLESIELASERRDFLAGADMKDLMDRPDFPAKLEDREMSFENAVRSTLKSDLAVELVRAGHIDRNYTLYTSTFYDERVSTNATNYIIKNVDPHVIDMAFELEPKDVRAILRERPDLLTQPAAYNISFFDYLLDKDAKRAEEFVNRLIRYDDDQRDFVHAYLETGTRKSKLIEMLASRWSGVYRLLISDAPISDEERTQLVDVALKHSQGAVDYVVDESIGSFVLTSYGSLDVFSSEETATDRATQLAELVNRAELWLPDLALLSPIVLKAVVRVGGYEITAENLRLALGDPTASLSLDAIHKIDKDVYDHVLDDMASYLEALGPDAPTIVAPGNFSQYVTDIHRASSASVEEVIRRASEECEIQLLTQTPVETWAFLAQDDRFPATFKNVDAYIEELGLDEDLAAVLTRSGELTVEDDDEDDVKLKVALVLLNASAQIPSAKLRADLVRSLVLDAHIPPSSIPQEEGELVGRLIENNEIKDAAESFTALKPNDLDGRAFAISKAPKFVTYMTTTEIAPSDVGRLVNSPVVPADVKDEIVDRFAEFTAGSSANGMWLVGRYAASAGKRLPLTEILRMAQQGVDAPLIVELLHPHLSGSSLAELSPVLLALGDNYAELTARNGKHPRFIKDQHHEALARRLIDLETVSSITDRDDHLVLNMLRS